MCKPVYICLSRLWWNASFHCIDVRFQWIISSEKRAVFTSASSTQTQVFLKTRLLAPQDNTANIISKNNAGVVQKRVCMKGQTALEKLHF